MLRHNFKITAVNYGQNKRHELFNAICRCDFVECEQSRKQCQAGKHEKRKEKRRKFIKTVALRTIDRETKDGKMPKVIESNKKNNKKQDVDRHDP